jgi:lipoprotein
VKNRRAVYAAILATAVLGITACGKTVVYDESNLPTETVKGAETTEGAVTEETGTESAESTDSGKPENDGARSAGIDKVHEVVDNKATNTKIEDEAKQQEVIAAIRGKLNEAHSSLSSVGTVNFEMIQLDKASYAPKRYIANINRTVKKTGKVYSVESLSDETYKGVESLTNRKTYLIDSGDRTLSYSKKYDSTLEDGSKKPWLAVIVDKDIENEPINLSEVDKALDLSLFEVGEETNDNIESYTLTCYIPIYSELELMGINPDSVLVSKDNSGEYKGTIKIYADKSDYTIHKIEFSGKKAMDVYYNNTYTASGESSEEVKIQKCRASFKLGDYSDLKIDIPKEIEEKLPEDAKAAAESFVTPTEDKESISLDGDFSLGLEAGSAGKTDESSKAGTSGADAATETSKGN